MSWISAIGAFLQLASLVIRAMRDPEWSREAEHITQAHLDRVADFARVARELVAASEANDPDRVARLSGELHSLWLRELRARGNTVAGPLIERGATVEIPVRELEQAYAELSGRRRDAELAVLTAKSK